MFKHQSRSPLFFVRTQARETHDKRVESMMKAVRRSGVAFLLSIWVMTGLAGATPKRTTERKPASAAVGKKGPSGKSAAKKVPAAKIAKKSSGTDARAGHKKGRNEIVRAKSGKEKVVVSTKLTASRRAAERRRAIAEQRRALEAARLARIRTVDNSLLATARTEIDDDDLTGEDMTVRRLAVEALGNNPGTVVVMDTMTGRVLSVVNQAWAVGRPFKPCSTIKLLTSWAALTEGIVDPDAPGAFGLTMRTALARSNNEYFQDLGEELGFDRLLRYARDAGFGRRTGINLPGEHAGYLPNGDESLRRASSHGDGYGVTAIQLAAFTAAIANGGTYYKPQIIRTAEDEKIFKPVVLRRLVLADADRAKLIEGMAGAVTFGTARRSNTAALGVVGKTGSCTCDCSPKTWLGLFSSFIDPSGLAITVITTGSSQRGALASQVAGRIFNGLGSAAEVRPRRVGPMRVERDANGNPLLTNRNK